MKLKNVALGLLAAIGATTVFAQSPAVMEGFPPSPESQVTFGNYRTSPFMEWSFRNVGAALNVVQIPRAGQIHELNEKHDAALGKVQVVDAKGNTISVDQLLEENHTDGFIVLQGDDIVFEKYFNGNSQHYQHIWFSATKSLTSTAFGIFADMYEVDLNASPVKYLPELKDSGFERVTIQDVLNHSTAIDFEENYVDPDSDFLKYYGPAMNMAYIPGGRDVQPGSTEIYGIYDFLGKFIGENEALEPGHLFEYNSANSDVLGWIMSRISGQAYNEFIQEHLWSKLGTENDAYMAVDRAFMPISTGGMNTTLRDAARFGGMILNRGFYNGQQIVPSKWVDASLELEEDDYLRTSRNPRYADSYQAYKNMWWVLDQEKGEYAAIGIHGQVIYINRDTETVVSFFSSQPGASAVGNEHIWSKIYAAQAIAAELK